MLNFARLRPFNEEVGLNMVVETPRGSSVKLRYDSEAEVFTVLRALALGLCYPFDWGFIPGTEAEDGDSVDALALHDNGTVPRGAALPRTQRGCLRVHEEIEQFFVSTTFFTGKDPTIEGWRGPKAALALVRRAKRTGWSKAAIGGRRSMCQPRPAHDVKLQIG